jgi:hypothetical protein
VKRRKDYRTSTPGSLGHYLIKQYPRGESLGTIPHHRFTEALEAIEKMDALRVPGRLQVAALRYYQKAKLNQALGMSTIKFAMKMETTEAGLRRWRDSCIAWVDELIPEATAEFGKAA